MRGVALSSRFTYSLGLGIPFLFAAASLDGAMRASPGHGGTRGP
jgi:cytochrome c biogenesis protein CcdA